VKFLRHFHLRTEQSGRDYEIFGSSEDHIRFVGGEAQEPIPYMMWCPKCGEIWARMPVDGSRREWRIIGGYCEQHPGPSTYVIHGSLMLNWEPELTAILPDDVIRREFDLHMRLWEKEQNEPRTSQTLPNS
jgi:hypothetical protein